MSIVDLAKARAYAEHIEDETAAEWVRELADEVESLERLLAATRLTTQAALSEAAGLAAERSSTVEALRELYGLVVTMLANLSKTS